MPESQKEKKFFDYSDASKKLFGIVFESKAKGFLAGLEFIAIVKGRLSFIEDPDNSETELFPELGNHHITRGYHMIWQGDWQLVVNKSILTK